ncbi:MAG: HD domain-containing protein [Candidatus Eisenbacteria bacterium]|nr:HD domain-containing protein [Candidatus Eisenbacteria bacterium]MCC7144198.1 HD domain-containing protein [Candidatus Eisenbacteria bacterium]
MQPQPTTRSFLRRFHTLLENTAHLLGVELEVWAEGDRPVATHRPPARCLDCSRRDPGLWAGCQEERKSRARRAIDLDETSEWTCPNGLTLAIQPIRNLEPASGALLSVEEPAIEGGSAPTLLAPEDESERRIDDEVYGALSVESETTAWPTEAELGALLDAAKNGAQLPEPELPSVSPTTRSARRRAFLADLTRLLSDQMYLFQECAHVNGELTSRYDELNMLYTISGKLASHEDMRCSLRQLCSQTRETLNADLAFLFIKDRRLSEVLPREGLELSSIGGGRQWNRLLQALATAMTDTGPTEFIGAPSQLLPQFADDEIACQMVATRVTVKEGESGVLAVLRFGSSASFRISDLKLLGSVGQQVAMAVSNCELYEDLQNFLMATVKSLVNAIEAKDRYTSGHSERVNLISMLIGKAMGLSGDELETLRWASILHDVGKIGMPECILNKPSHLSPEEQAIMREHPDRGYHVLAPIRQLSTPAVSVRAHHERWDGNGYPLGLSGRDIPRIARIIAVADTFDAITTTRPYRTARSFDYAVRQILRVRGAQLDPEVVDVFLTLIPFLEEHHVMIHAAAESVREGTAA